MKWSATVEPRPPPRSTHALAVALAAPCGPVHLDLPRTVGAQDRGRRRTARRGLVAAPASLDHIVAALSAAAQPVILAGLEAARTLSPGALAALAERLGAPVLTTYKAKGVLDEAHPLWAGIVTGGAIEAPLLEAADAILAVGLDPSSC